MCEHCQDLHKKLAELVSILSEERCHRCHQCYGEPADEEAWKLSGAVPCPACKKARSVLAAIRKGEA